MSFGVLEGRISDHSYESKKKNLIKVRKWATMLNILIDNSCDALTHEN